MGKSATAALFAEAGVPVFDADAAVHRLYAGRAAPFVEARFPGSTAAGAVDREALGRRVVDDAEALGDLERIVHPLVREEREAFLAGARRDGASVVVLDIPLLFETGADALVDQVVVASAPEPVQKARVLARPGMTAERFAAMLARQMPDAEKRRRASAVIDTGAGFESARRQVRAVLARLAGQDGPVA